MPALVELRNVTKTFPGVKALDRVSLSVFSGECLALVGENGAGKSTLMKILSGTYPAGTFDGEILIDGKRVDFRSPLDAEDSGVAIIHQELSGFAHLSVAENLFVGHWPTTFQSSDKSRALGNATGNLTGKAFGAALGKTFGLVAWEQIREEARQWLDAVGCQCDPDQPLGSLAVGEQQMVEIAKALSRKSRVLILDEPTSALTPREVETLFRLIRDLRSKGVGLVYISHKMEEIYALADRITVLRDGKSVHSATAVDLPEDKLITQMVGRSLTGLYPVKPSSIQSDVVLDVVDFEGKALDGKKLFGPVSFNVRKGEIVGFAGLLGAGRSETLRGLFGDPAMQVRGKIKLNGQSLSVSSPRAALREGIAFVAEDRKRDSILPGRSLEENVSLARLVSGTLSHLLRLGPEFVLAKTALKRLSTKATGPEQEIQQLSGGNQQKVILARALETAPDVILLDEPTRGVDVGAKYEIYEILFRLAAEGKSLIVVSSDLPELMALADRIVVLSSGKQTGELERKNFTQEAIMTLAVKG